MVEITRTAHDNPKTTVATPTYKQATVLFHFKIRTITTESSVQGMISFYIYYRSETDNL